MVFVTPQTIKILLLELQWDCSSIYVVNDT